MKTISISRFILAFIFSTVIAASAHAHEYKVGDITIEHPWARASAGAATSGGAFLKIHNEGTAPDRLVAVTSPVAKKAHLHTTIMENDVMKMRPLDAIDIPANGMVELKPGSFHVMFMGLTAPFVEGEMFPLTLTFEKAGTLDVEVYITEVGAMGSMDGMNMGN